MISYHALRRVGTRIEEIKVTRPKGGGWQDMVEEHVNWHSDEQTAKDAMRRANGVAA